MNHLPRIAIMGGGIAGWMAAAAFANAFKSRGGRITLIETPQTPSGGEAAIPTIRSFNEKLGIDEDTFIRATQATFSLGTEFRDWLKPGSSFFHPFGQYGTGIENVGFHHCWFRLRQLGDTTGLSEYSLASIAASLGKFMRPSQDAGSVLSSFSYGFHFDSQRYASLLRDYALARAVTLETRAIKDASLRSDNGFIDGLVLEDGAKLEADLYIDCSGNAGVLIEQALRTGYEDWSHWLPCDRMAVSENAMGDDVPPFTRVTATDPGWQLQIPLQNRISNGFAYSSRFVSDDAASAMLPKSDSTITRKFKNGRRRKFWNGNCVALGAAAGFLEPLEGTNVHLIQSSITRLLYLLPNGAIDPAMVDEYNRLTTMDYEQIRDFLILHYRANQHAGSAFWDHAARIPETLAFKIDLFKSRGRVTTYGGETFFLPSWLSLYSGLGITPERYHPFADSIDVDVLKYRVQSIRTAIRKAAEGMPRHADFLAQTVGAT